MYYNDNKRSQLITISECRLLSVAVTCLESLLGVWSCHSRRSPLFFDFARRNAGRIRAPSRLEQAIYVAIYTDTCFMFGYEA
jgi:hypothetical protein